MVLFQMPERVAEHVAEVLGEAFVDPEQVVLHGLLIVAGGEARGAAVLAVPGVRELVRQQQAIVDESLSSVKVFSVTRSSEDWWCSRPKCAT